MKENMLDVLLYLFEFCSEEEWTLTGSQEALHGKLVKAGFHDEEIDKAFSWLRGLASLEGESEPAIGQPDVTSMRAYREDECLRIPVESRGFLLLLEQLKVLDPVTRERIIERAMALDLDELDLDHFKWVVMMVLLNNDDESPSFLWLEDFLLDSEPASLH